VILGQSERSSLAMSAIGDERKCYKWNQSVAVDPICDISAQFLLLCTAAFFPNGVVMWGAP